MTEYMQAGVLVGKKQIEIQNVPVPPVGPGMWRNSYDW